MLRLWRWLARATGVVTVRGGPRCPPVPADARSGLRAAVRQADLQHLLAGDEAGVLGAERHAAVVVLIALLLAARTACGRAARSRMTSRTHPVTLTQSDPSISNGSGRPTGDPDEADLPVGQMAAATCAAPDALRGSPPPAWLGSVQSLPTRDVSARRVTRDTGPHVRTDAERSPLAWAPEACHTSSA